MKYKEFTLDRFQEEAIQAIDSNKSVVVSAPTGSGKTLIADYIINRDVKKGIKVIYTAPIKALSNQKYKEFCAEYGEESVGLITGDVVRNPGGLVLIMTTEVYRNMVMTGDPLLEGISYAIFDEIHYINDIERGVIWEESIIFSKRRTRMLCLSATIPNAEEFADWIRSIKRHEVVVVLHEQRPIPLRLQFYDEELGVTTLEKINDVAGIPDYHHFRGRRRRRLPPAPQPDHTRLIKAIIGKTPCFFFCFSRAGCQKNSLELLGKGYFEQSPQIVSHIAAKLRDAPPDIAKLPSAKLLRQTLPHGIGFHHAGLLPILKELVEELFALGLIHVLYTTETFAVGINMPAKTVCFESLRKFDGRGFRLLNSKEFFQIAGRAGRRGIDTEGFVIPMIARRDFNYKAIQRVTDKDIEPIRSQYRLSVNTVLNLIHQHDAKEIAKILRMSFHSFQQYGRAFHAKESHAAHRTFMNLKKSLSKRGYLKGSALTEKGLFASKIYADELLTAELFTGHFYAELNEYQMLLAIACLCYEARENTQFHATFPARHVKELERLLQRSPFLMHEQRFSEAQRLTALIHPLYHGRSIFDVIGSTNLPEGDILRLLRQMLDRINQIRHATDDRRLEMMMGSCADVINHAVKDVDVV